MKLLGTAAVSLTIALGTLVSSGNADDPRREKVETQDVLLLADNGPVLLRWHVQIDGKPHAAAWERYLDKLFADLDRDGDGFLSKTEAARAPTVEFLQSFLQGGLDLEAAADTVPFNRLDADGDGRISRSELSAYYRQCAFDRLRVVLVPDRGNAAALTDALFQLLDVDRDGKLSKAELQGAAATLRQVDLNEDEWITPDELLLHRPAAAKAPKAMAPTLDAVGFVPVAPTGLSEELVRAVLARYAGQGKLDGRALKALASQAPQLELIVRLGKLDKDAARIDIFNPTQRPMPLAQSVRRTDEGALLVDAGGLALEVQAGPADGSVRGLNAFYRQQFAAADADRRGFLERTQAADVPTLAALFRLANRAADGKLTEKEFDSFLDLHALGAASFVSLTVTDQSLGLFDLLDEDHDGRLSLRELHTAWDRLRVFDRGSGKLGRDEFPRRLRARLGQGKASLRQAAKGSPTPAPAKPRGPAWFRKMDRNGDGYVSRREFLGSEELFNKLDTDGDGLISPEEAERLEDEHK